MHALSIVTIPAVALRYRCGRAFSHSPTLVQVDAATMARLQADSALIVQPAALSDCTQGPEQPPNAAPAPPKGTAKQGKR